LRLNARSCRQAGGALGRALDLIEVLIGGIVGLVTGEHELAAPDDHGEHIVEVVRDAAREPSDRLDLLELPHLALALAQDVLGAVALGDVPPHPGEPSHPTVLVGERRAGPLVGDQDAIGAAQAALDLERSGLEGRAERRAERLAVFLGEQVGQQLTLERLPGAAGDALELLVPERQAACAVDHVDDVGDRLDESLQLLVGGAEPTAALAQRARENRGEGAGDVEHDQVERRDHRGVRKLERRAQHARVLQRHDRDVAARGCRRRGQARPTRERDAGVDHHDEIDAEAVRGGEAAGEVEADADEEDVDEHPDVGLGPEGATASRREEVRAVQEEPEEREQRDAPRGDRRLHREDELERDDDQRDPAADRQLLIEPQPAAELFLCRVVPGPLERGTSVDRPAGFRHHPHFSDARGVP